MPESHEPRCSFCGGTTVCMHAECALWGAGGVCGEHGGYDGTRCLPCVARRLKGWLLVGTDRWWPAMFGPPPASIGKWEPFYFEEAS